MNHNLLKEADFVDLYLGRDYAEIKGLVGESSLLVPVPDNLKPDTEKLRTSATDEHNRTGRYEFSLFYDERLYRITVTADLFGDTNLVIRQTPPEIRAFNTVPLSTPLRTSVVFPGATGLFLIAGEMGSGKTTTAAAVLRERVAVTGSLSVSIEDPAETLLQGRHGAGRCMQLEVKENETYASATKKAYRMGASSFLLGEIRDAATAHEVLKASLSMFVVSTIHASSLTEALERYVMFCEEISTAAKANIASTLYVLVHQRMRVNPNDNTRQVEITGFNLKNTPSAPTIRAKIAGGNFHALTDDFSSISYDFKE
ncbi:ATPase, T2SS/T4P/T4SS family [Erwinia rhapontici]|uniref:ATPase, T2SS/T4P/T4SS family n=1 Tax=Erwinia rhapontici TaxID=55212 RepID=UPI001331490E|nr:ATPase, T2SS/T4P/T4SS family [Erwinia rhapontici]MBP2157392.1 twitching motility protein PilT [Erwinia rhapontici]